MNITTVCIKRMATTSHEYDAIRIHVADMWFERDIGTDRDIRLAKKLADEHGAMFYTDAHNEERVSRALAKALVSEINGSN